MPTEPNLQPTAQACEVTPVRTAQGCPACGAALVPLRGQWRCSRCYFALCVGCEPVGAYEAAERG